jgi:hypothetical protein
MRVLARWSEFVFALISLFFWAALPLPPTARVLWNWVVMTVSVVLGITFFIWLKRGSRAAWVCAGVWAALVVADILIGIVRAGFPEIPWGSAAMAISFLLVYVWGLTQALVLLAVIRWFLQQDTARALGA